MAQSDVMRSFLTRRSAHHKAKPSSRTKCASRSACGTHRSKNEKAVQWTAFVFGCGGGIFHCPPQSHSRNAREACFASFLLALWGIAARKQRTVLFSLAHPLPPSAKRPKVVHRFKSTQAKKEKNTPRGCVFLFWLRGWDLNLTTSGL